MTAISETAHLILKNGNVKVGELNKIFDPHLYFENQKSIRYSLGESFRKYLLSQVSIFDGLPAMFFSFFETKSTSFDNDHIMEELGITEASGKLMTKEEILWSIAYLTSKQPNGENGTLRVDGYATIIGYFTCDDGAVRVAYVCRSAAEWHCCVVDLINWNKGRGVLCRN